MADLVFKPDETDDSDSTSMPGGGPALPVLPEDTLAPPERANFTMPLEAVIVVVDGRIDLAGFDGHPPGVGMTWEGGADLAAERLDRIPRPRVQTPPEYPLHLRQDGIGGVVTVEFEVNAEGRVVGAEAVNFSRREFVDPAVRAVMKWRFEPGRRNGKVVPFRMKVPIEFGMDGG